MDPKSISAALPDAAVARRVEALFRAMAGDFLLREQFVTDPVQIVSEYVHGARLSPETASVNNQLLYSVMSNPRLLDWVRRYVVRHHSKSPTPQQAAIDFSNAVIASGAHDVVLALIRSTTEKQPLLAFRRPFLSYVFGPANPFTGRSPFGDNTDIGPTTQTTDTGPTTQTTDTGPTTQTTDTGPTTQTTDTGPTTQTTDTGPTTQTDNMPQFGGLFDRGYVAVSLLALARFSVELKNLRALELAWSDE
jgi:hypothetical protein